MIECLTCGKTFKDEGPFCDCPPKIVKGVDFSKVWKPDFIPLMRTRDHSKMLEVQPIEQKEIISYKKTGDIVEDSKQQLIRAIDNQMIDIVKKEEEKMLNSMGIPLDYFLPPIHIPNDVFWRMVCSEDERVFTSAGWVDKELL